MPRTFDAVCRIGIVCCLCVAIALSMQVHLLALQSVAWARMLVSFSQTAPLEKALAMTFDGEHPCKLCKEISKAKGAERQKSLQAHALKVDLYFKGAPAILFPPEQVAARELLVLSHPARFEQPLAPPPRAA